MIQKLLGLEWMKVRSYKTFWIMLGLFVLGFFGLVYIIYAIKYETAGQMGTAFLDSYFRYPQIGKLTAYMGSFMLLVLGVIIITQIANEFSFRTHRQNIIDGLSRGQFVNAKWYNAIVLSLLAGVTHLLFTALFALLGDGGTMAGFLNSFVYSFYFTLNALMWLSIAIVLTLWLKRSGLAISLFFVYGLILENLLSYILRRATGVSIGEYLPIHIVDGLCPNILLQLVNPASRPPEWGAVIIACVYIAGFYILSRRMVKQMDLK